MKLAIDGGTATWTQPLSPWPSYAPDEVNAVSAVLRSGKVNQWTGPDVRAFEQEFASYVGTARAVAVANGTVSIELALLASDIGEGDEVIVPPRTFVATASAVVSTGARPVFADVDRDWGNLTAASIEAALTPDTRAVIVVHLGGMPAEMNAIIALCEDHDLVLIEDCAQSHGATYYGAQTGSLGDLASFSFCQDKIMSTGGEGGMVTLNHEDTYRTIWELKDHGKSYEAVFETEHEPGFRWLHEGFGTNLRMTGMQAAIGRVQLAKLDSWRAARAANAAILTERLKNQPALRIPTPPAHIVPAWYKYYAYVRPEALAEGWTRDRILLALQAEGVPGLSGSCSEIYLEKAFDHEDLRPAERLPVAKELGQTSLMMLVHPTLTSDEVHAFADALIKVLSVATRA